MSTYDYRRLIAMRECLRQVQKLLPKSAEDSEHSPYICYNLNRTSCSQQAQHDTAAYVMASIAPAVTFQGRVYSLNDYRRFSPTHIMRLRQKFIDSLCDRLNQEIEKVRS